KYPQNTEVLIAIVGCEEVGLRGSQAFATRHAAEFNTIDTTCVNFESVSDAKRVTIFNEEKTTGTKLSPEVFNLLDQCAAELGIRHVLDHMPGVAGGSDAAGMVRGGLKASTLCGLKYKDYLAYYHTDRDNLDRLNKERRPWADHGKTWDTQNVLGAMEQSLCVGVRYLEKKDAE
ncbi:MAG TPA: M28 family peptidase, partial [Candidatus Lokiarchaeia archaeon]|nr:M28 family peptidase [Candidatus Lokiarchaeia archaeon]